MRGGVRAGAGGEVSSTAERHRAADRGEGATGAGQSRPGSLGRSRRRGAAVSDGARTLLGGDESRRASSTGANPGGGGGSATPSPRGRTGPGRAPPEGHRGGGRGWAPGLRGPGPGSAWAGAGETGRALGLQLGGGGAGGLCWLGANPERPLGAGRGPPRAAAPWGGGVLPARGTTGAPLERGGGGGRVSPGVGPCRFMAARHRTISPTLRAGVPFWWGGGGGGAGGCCVHPPMRGGGGSPVGAPSGMAEKTRWRPLGSWAPSRKNLGFAGRDSAIWYGMVWYGMLLLLLLLRAPSTCRREKLPDTLSLGRAQGSSRPASCWPGVCRRRPRGGGGGRRGVGGGVGRVWRRVGLPEDVTLGPSPVSRGESYSSCAKRLWRGRRVGRRPWGGEGTPGSTDSRRLARTSRRGGHSSCEAVAWPGALARASSLLRGRGEAWDLRSAGA